MADSTGLLEHVDFLRGLARSLLRDEAAADDVVQDALVAAMERPDIPEARRRRWLVGVVRNLVRMTFRRRHRTAARERLAGERAPALAAAEVVTRMETTRRIVDAVDSLEERYRVVVVLRYHDDLRPVEIAEKLDVPAATVRTRLHRARILLRAKLGEKRGESRRSWALALIPLAWPRPETVSTGLPSIGGVLVKKVAVVMAVLLLLVLLGAAVLQARRGGDGADTTVARSSGTADLTHRSPPPGTASVAAAEATTADSTPESEAAPPEDVAEIVVRGEDGRPIPGAAVTLMRDGFEEFPINVLEPVETRVSDARGRVRFTVTPHYRYQLKVSHPDRCVAGDATCFGGERTDFELPRGGVLEGTVTDARSGQPVRGASLHVYDWTISGMLQDWRATTDAEGRYRIDGIGPGRLNVRAWSPEHGEAYPEDVPRITAGAVTRADIALPEGVRLCFRVVDENTGEVLPDVEIWSITRRVARGEGEDLRTQPLSATSPRTELAFRAPGYMDERYVVVVGEVKRPTDPVPIAMTPGIPVRGRLVRPDGEPLVGVPVEIRSGRSRSTRPTSLVTTTDARGRFAIRAAHAGGFVRLLIEIPTGGFGWGDELTVPAGAKGFVIPPLVVHPDRTVAGVLLDAAGRPVAGDRINARAAVPGHNIMVLGATDTKGRFLLRGLPPGPFRLLLWRDFGKARRFLDVPDPGDVSMTWRLEPGLVIAGRAEYTDGTPVPLYAVNFTDADGEYVGLAQLDREGRFRMTGLPPGKYRLELALHPEATIEDVPAGSEDVRLTATR